MKRAIGRVPGQWDDDKCISWAKGKHVARVYPQFGIEVAKVEYVDVNDLPLNEQFKMAKTMEEKVYILGRRMFGITDGDIQIFRGSNGLNNLTEAEDDGPEIEAFFCEAEDCSRFFDSEQGRDTHQRSHSQTVGA